MSSIRQQEPMKPSSKSPIPRSRSDFNYVGLTPKEKRWTTDFSLLLPPFSRDTSGYSRLAESPVTHQPKPINQNRAFTKSPTSGEESSRSSESRHLKCLTSNEGNTSNPKSSGPSALGIVKSLTLGQSAMNTTTKQVPACDCMQPRPMGRSRTLEPINYSETKRTKTVRSPTFEPHNASAKKLYPTIELSSLATNKSRNPLSTVSNRLNYQNEQCLKTINSNRMSLPANIHSSTNQSLHKANPQGTKHLPSKISDNLMTSPVTSPSTETYGSSKPQYFEGNSQSLHQENLQSTKHLPGKNVNGLLTSPLTSPTVETHSCLRKNPFAPEHKRTSSEGAFNLPNPGASCGTSNSYQLQSQIRGTLRTNPFTSESFIPPSHNHPVQSSKQSSASNDGNTNINSYKSPEPSGNSNTESRRSSFEARHQQMSASLGFSSKFSPNQQPNSTETGHYLRATPRHLTPESGRHLTAIRKSPTMDSRTLRYSPLLSQHFISRSPTLDPSVLSRARGPVAVSRSPLTSRVGMTKPEVVRSQSLRSLRKEMDNSPAKIRNSESAQSDVTCPIHRAFPLVEADEFDADDFRRLRNFSVTNKGLINWGDSFRSQSLTSVPDPALPYSNSQWDMVSTKSYPMTSSNSQWTCSNRIPQRYRVAIVGAYEVGKTSVIRQFQTSEYICAFDTSYDLNKEYAITVILNKEESELEFIEHRISDEADDSKPSVPLFADAYVVVYSVTNRRSFCRALDLLARLKNKRSAVLLVGNKSDLVRVRAVTTDEGQSAAKDHGCPFIETSAAINHQVDELLVAILTHIRARVPGALGSRRPHPSSLSRAKGLIKKFLKKACFQAKSSENLQRL
ncbi:hypothetical protein JTE90_015409 [Oedothorax gibbosus]|uniref:GTP-binding protein REM 1 n=1 Tax=Oedothorax gibbosus TaxID=931172 RepID=A0AAV6U928_9ARAC|nr:hypothetical protein JTE90_015409 [Oedothorax gibbosus]